MIEVVNNIAPLKTARIKNTINEWFDTEIAEKLNIRDKLSKKFKSTVSTWNDIQRNKTEVKRGF